MFLEKPREAGQLDKSEAMVVFSASVPPLQGWIRISGDGGARIQLDVPDTDLADVLKLILWRDKELRVTVRPVRE